MGKLLGKNVNDLIKRDWRGFKGQCNRRNG